MTALPSFLQLSSSEMGAQALHADKKPRIYKSREVIPGVTDSLTSRATKRFCDQNGKAKPECTTLCFSDISLFLLVLGVYTRNCRSNSILVRTNQVDL
jgi:hypothetical protein